MAIFERETKVKIPEIRLGDSIVANYASLSQTIDNDSGREVVLQESAQILWGATKETLQAEIDKKILISQKTIELKQAEITKNEAIKLELDAISVDESVKP